MSTATGIFPSADIALLKLLQASSEPDAIRGGSLPKGGGVCQSGFAAADAKFPILPALPPVDRRPEAFGVWELVSPVDFATPKRTYSYSYFRAARGRRGNGGQGALLKIEPSRGGC